MGEGKPVELDGLRLEGAKRLSPGFRLGGALQNRLLVTEIGHDQRRFDARDLRDDFGDLVANRERLGAIIIAVAGDQDLGLDLPEPVENALHAEIGRSARPDRPERRGREQPNDRLGLIGHKRRDPVALANALSAQKLLGPADRRMEFRPGQGFLDLVLAPENQGVVVIVLAQQVFSIVETGAFEEFRFFEPLAQSENRTRRPCRRSRPESPRPSTRTLRFREPRSREDPRRIGGWRRTPH